MTDDRQTREKRFRCLYDAHSSAVRGYAWRREPDIADDIVAETFTLAWQRLDKVPDDALPWLLGVARNVRLNLTRGERRRRERELRCVEPDTAPSPGGEVEARSSLNAILRRLHQRDREILLLAAWERLDRADLATVLGCSKATAAVRLLRARRHLTAVLAEASAEPRISPSDIRGGLPDEN